MKISVRCAITYLGECTSLPLPSLAVEDESLDESHPQSDSPAGGVPSPFPELIMRVRELLQVPELWPQSSMLQTGVQRTSGSWRQGPTHSLGAYWFSPCREQVQCSLRNLNAAWAKLSLAQRWGLWVDPWYTPEGSWSGPPPLNEELPHVMQNRDLSVTIPWRLATQIQGVLSGVVDINSYTNTRSFEWCCRHQFLHKYKEF